MMTISRHSLPASPLLGGFGRRHRMGRHRAPVRAVLDLLMQWQGRAEQRYALAELDARLLRDIGVDRIAAAQEARKPFWKA